MERVVNHCQGLPREVSVPIPGGGTQSSELGTGWDWAQDLRLREGFSRLRVQDFGMSWLSQLSPPLSAHPIMGLLQQSSFPSLRAKGGMQFLILALEIGFSLFWESWRAGRSII